MKTLIIDTSHNYLIVGLAQDGVIKLEYQEKVNKKHSELLLVKVDQMMKELNWTPHDLEEIVVTDGPGSYTGMRIGITFVKTLLLVVPSIKVYTVDTLLSLVGTKSGFALLDARSSRVFGARVNNGIVYYERIYNLEDLSSLDLELFGDRHLLKDQTPIFDNISQNILDVRANWVPVTNVDTLVPRYIK